MSRYKSKPKLKPGQKRSTTTSTKSTDKNNNNRQQTSKCNYC